MRRLGAWALAAAIGIGLAGCSVSTASPEVGAMASDLSLTSPAFDEGGAIPRRYTCDGEGLTPPLRWDGTPGGVEAFALIVEDPDAGGFVHWVLSDIPGDLHELPEGQGDAIGAPGANSAGGTGWTGPCPPSGEHHYVFTLYALSAQLSVVARPSAAEVRAAMAGLLLGQAELTGVYARE